MNQHNHHYLFHLNSGSGSCYRCVAFFPVHKNVLQFKQTRCIQSFADSENIGSVCRRSFRGDAPMTTLFRANASSERCPFEAPFNFTYFFIDGSCTSRISTVTACASPHRFRFQYQACPEVPHTETHADEVECIAKWNSFGVEYFAVKLTNSFAPSHSARFRCIIHERASSGGRMGISADASCSELTDMSFASTVLNYKQDSAVTARCHFPPFLVHDHHSDAPRIWKSIVTDHTHRFSKDEWIEQWEGLNRSVSLCVDEENLGSAHRLIVHAVHGCSSGYQCIKFLKRKRNIVDMVRGKMSSNEFEACEHLRSETVETLLLEGSKPLKCPVKGRHSRSDCPNAAVHFGCRVDHSIQLRPYCNSNETQEMVCLGHWTEDDVHYVIAEESITKKRFCYVYSSLASGAARIRSFRHAACHPQTPQRSTPQYDFSASRLDECEPMTSAWERNGASINVASFSIFVFFSFWR
ncbi:hypothetical protein Tcan_09072 [Toxocara canis]|uniref:Uncharacterized protein n=1 Tax=Toxocara canis TaxID=6265 RepID=A0A0B2V9U3_TOXCA|nr:hypothetical protein Tcan_09072 [Toxocara canis]